MREKEGGKKLKIRQNWWVKILKYDNFGMDFYEKNQYNITIYTRLGSVAVGLAVEKSEKIG